jgi:hypothetical protein
MGFALKIEKGVPIPPQARKGEDSEVAKAMLQMEVGDCHKFQEYDENGKPTEESKTLKYNANRLYKKRRARYSFRKGEDDAPSQMWRVAMDAPVDSVPVVTTETVNQQAIEN